MLTDNPNIPRFRLELSLAYHATRIKVDEQGISEQTLNEAWYLLNGFLMDMVDEQGLEPNDEQFRELFIELCYKLVYREMTVLNLMPEWEKNWKAGIAKGKQYRGPRRAKKGDSN